MRPVRCLTRLARIFDYLLGTHTLQRPTTRPRLGMETLEGRDVPAVVAVPDVFSYDIYLMKAFKADAPGVLANDAGDGSPLTASLVSGPSHGTLHFFADGSFTYSLNRGGGTGPDSFKHQVTDGHGHTGGPVTVYINGTPNPTLPAAAGGTYTTPANTTLTVSAANGLLQIAAPQDSDGNAVTVAQAGGPLAGLTLNPNGSFTYVPTTGFVGDVTFQYTATNGLSTTAPATVTISVGSVVSVSNGGDATEGGVNGKFVFTRTGDTSQPITVSYSVVDLAEMGHATIGDDFGSIGTSVTIPAGLDRAEVQLVAYADDVYDLDELVTVLIDNGNGYSIKNSSTESVTIHDVENTFSFTFGNGLQVITIKMADGTATITIPAVSGASGSLVSAGGDGKSSGTVQFQVASGVASVVFADSSGSYTYLIPVAAGQGTLMYS